MTNDLLTQATCMVTSTEIGTGWLASSEGHIITAAHVLSTDKTTVPTEVSVKFGNSEALTAKQIAWHYHHDHGLDVAILKLDSLPAGLSPLPISLVTEVEGDCRLVGYGKPFMNRSSGKGKLGDFVDCENNSAYRLFRINSTELAAEGYSGGAIFSMARYFLIIFFLITILTQSTPLHSHAQVALHQVLILNSYHQGLSWTDNLMVGLKSVLQTEPIELQIEYMDTKRIFDEQYMQDLYNLYKYKFRKFEVIIVSDNDAFNFLRQYGNELFPNTPVVFCGINFFQDVWLEGHPLFTGVAEMPNIKSTLDLALKLHPRTKQIMVINDATTTGLATHKLLEEVIPSYQTRVKFLFYENLDMADLLEKLPRLPKDSLVFLILFNRDKSGKFFTYEQAIDLIYAKTDVPIYGVWDFYLGRGMVGGMLTSSYAQGEAAGKMALRILQGEKVANIPVLKDSPNRTMFDYRQLKRFDIDTTELPQNSLIINQPISFYEQNKIWLWGTSGLLIIIALLGLSNIARIRAEQALRNYQEQLEELVAERTAALQATNENLQHEIIEREQAEAETRAAKIAAETANRAKSEFLANMSHELRTPLNGILGYAQILKRNKGLNSAQIDGLDIIQQSGEHLLTLISDILDLSKIEASKMEIYPTDIYFPEFLNSIVGIMRMRAQEKDISFIYQPSPSLPVCIQADEKRLRQILINLLGNAIKFTDEGSVKLRITNEELRITNTESVIRNSQFVIPKIRFEVIDSGIGMTSAQLEKIFLPFEQVGDTRRRAEGTGLGLAISRKLVQAMGSDLQVTSEHGKGSTFWFDLLVVSNELTGIHATNDKQLTIDKIIGYQGRRLKMLVVDDKHYNRSVLLNMLEPLGFEIVEAEDGQQGIDKTLAVRPDIILMDMVMPVMTGFEAVQKIRQIPELKEMVIIAVTASVFESDKQQIMLAGCNDFLSKPVNMEKLLTMLESHLKLAWIYEESELESDNSAETTILPSHDSLIPPPMEELKILFDLAMRGNMISLEERAIYLENLDKRFKPFTNKLNQLVKGFDDEQIIALISQYMETTNEL